MGCGTSSLSVTYLVREPSARCENGLYKAQRKRRRQKRNSVSSENSPVSTAMGRISPLGQNFPMGNLHKSQTTRVDSMPFIEEDFQVSGDLGETQHVEICDLVGKGGYGCVYEAKWSRSKTLATRSEDMREESEETLQTVVAAKFEAPDSKRKLLQNEAIVLATLDYPFIVKLFHGVFQEERSALLLEYAPGGHLLELFERFQRAGILTLPVMQYYFACCILGTVYVHCKGYVHNDIKPANFVVKADGRAMLCDFGLAVPRKSYSPERSGSGANENTANENTPGVEAVKVPFGGTKPFMAPEKKFYRQQSFMSDYYSLGVTFFQLITGEYPCKFDHSRPLPGTHLPRVADDVNDVDTQLWLKESTRALRGQAVFGSREDVMLHLRVSQRAIAPDQTPLYGTYTCFLSPCCCSQFNHHHPLRLSSPSQREVPD